MATGVPLVSSDLPVLREVLRNGHNSLLVPPDDVPAWIAALDRLLAQPALAQALGGQAHAEYRAHHTWTRRAEALLAAAEAL
jgi:glycosyltransferase involved in cell wall biosynthesis